MEELINKIHNAECLEFMKQLPDKCVDLVLTDPPYGIEADKGSNGFGASKVNKYKGEWDKEIPDKEYFDEMVRISKNQVIFGGNYFTEILKPTNSWIIWDKIGEMNFKNPFSDCELAWSSFSFVMKKITVIQQGFVNEDKKHKRIHATQKPVKLFSNIVYLCSKENDLILDCFSGSGTTAIACHDLKRRFICIEKDVDYYNASVKRLEEHQRQLSLF